MKQLIVLCAYSVLCQGAVTYEIGYVPANDSYSPLNFSVTVDDYLTPGVWGLTDPVPLSFSDGQVTNLNTLIVRQFTNEFELCFGNGISYSMATGTVYQALGSAVLGIAFNGPLPTTDVVLSGGYGGSVWLIEGQGGVGSPGVFSLAVSGTGLERQPEVLRSSAFLASSFNTPTAEAPEPSTLSFSCLAIGVLLFFRWRSKVNGRELSHPAPLDEWGSR